MNMLGANSRGRLKEQLVLKRKGSETTVEDLSHRVCTQLTNTGRLPPSSPLLMDSTPFPGSSPKQSG